MKFKMPIRCRIPDTIIGNDISWLEIHEADGGYYIFQYTEIKQPPKYDSFTDDIEDLLSDCKESWGIDYST
jgi:hypothetical protein